MATESTQSMQQMARWYVQYYQEVFLFIKCRIGRTEEAEDLSQDVFLRLMECAMMLRAETVRQYIYTISRNLVTDWLRRHYKREEITSYIYEHSSEIYTSSESRIIADDIAELEVRKLQQLPAQRRRVYAMSRYADKTVADISAELNLSVRTVENHLRLGRKEMREYLRQCI